MGTRGTTGFIADGKTFAAYQQYDSYPSGVGQQVLEFCRTHLRNPLLRADYKAAVLALTVVDESASPTVEQAAALAEYHENVSTGNDWYATLRGTQGRPDLILKSGYIYDSVANLHQEEYDWQIDFDANMFRGFAGDALIAEYSLDALPTDEVFLAAANAAAEAAWA